MEQSPKIVGMGVEGEMPAHLRGSSIESFQPVKLPEYLQEASDNVDDLVEKSGLLDRDWKNESSAGHVERMNELSRIISTNPDKDIREQAKKEYEQLGGWKTKHQPVEYGSK